MLQGISSRSKITLAHEDEVEGTISMSINMFRDTINGGIASLFISERQAIYLKVTASWATKTIKTRVVEIRGSRVRLDEVIDIEYPGIETFRAEMEVPLIEISVMRDMGK